MNLGDCSYDQSSPDYQERSDFHDTHNNISISAVISSSCVVLEGIRNNSDCGTALCPIGEDGQSFFPHEYHSSIQSCSSNVDQTMSSYAADRLNVSSSLHFPSADLTCCKHFFESAATEFTTAEDEANVNCDIVLRDSQFLTHSEADISMTTRPHFNNTFIYEGIANGIHHSESFFSHRNSFISSEEYNLCSPDCHSANVRSDHTHGSSHHCSLLSKTYTTSLNDNSAPFIHVAEKANNGMDDTANYWTTDSCDQNHDSSGQIQSPQPSNNRIQDSFFQGTNRDTVTSNSEFSTLQERLTFSPHNSLNRCTSPLLSQTESLASYTINTSFNHSSLVSEAPGFRDCHDSSTNSDCVLEDSCRQASVEFPRADEIQWKRSKLKEKTKYVGAESLQVTINKSVSPKKISDTEPISKNRCVRQNIDSSSRLEHEDFSLSSSYLSQNDTVKNVNGVHSIAADISKRAVSSSKSNRKHVETVESLQHHLDVLEDRQQKMAPSCMSLNLLRQRSQVAEEMSGNDKSLASVVDVDYMMCSGVTVAGFKPRAIIRKRSKTSTPTDVKDTEYWQKRRKNNDSARKSRESKKEKEKNFYKRALELEYENLYLQECLSLAEAELATLGHPFVPPVFGGQCYY